MLEAGCGVGNCLFPLLEEDMNIFAYACDFSPRAVEFVKVGIPSMCFAMFLFSFVFDLPFASICLVAVLFPVLSLMLITVNVIFLLHTYATRIEIHLYSRKVNTLHLLHKLNYSKVNYKHQDSLLNLSPQNKAFFKKYNHS